MGSTIVTPEEVLESSMNDGTIDAIRSKIINQIKANLVGEKPLPTFSSDSICIPPSLRHFPWYIHLAHQDELKSTAILMVEQSRVLNTPGAEKQTKRELFDGIRRELETPVLEKASKAVWELILDDDGLGKEISETVERVYYRLSGQEPAALPPPPPLSSPPPPPPPPAPAPPANGVAMDRQYSRTPFKKRNFAEMTATAVGEGNNVISVSSGALPQVEAILPIQNHDFSNVL